MAHLLLLDVPGGNDFTVLEDAVACGHEVTFFTSDLGHYLGQGEITEAALALAREVIEVAPFSYEALEHRALALHGETPFDALICMIDIRLVEASRLAARLGLRFLNPVSARLLRDKVSVRRVLAEHGIRQPRFALAESLDDLRRAVREIGYPVLVKPSDGYGSQNVNVIFDDAEFDAFCATFLGDGHASLDYGLGVQANNRFSVEQYVAGQLVGCDIFSDGTERRLLGINEKVMFPPPSFAMRGSCFPADRADAEVLRDYAFGVLDAVNFDFGATHMEIMVADDGPYLVEVNPRLVGAHIPFQMAYAFERSIYVDLINLHLGLPVADLPREPAPWFSVIRWITANRPGTLRGIHLPADPDPLARRVTLFKDIGAPVRPPLCNSDRIGYVIAVGKTPDAAARLADDYVRDTQVDLG